MAHLEKKSKEVIESEIKLAFDLLSKTLIENGEAFFPGLGTFTKYEDGTIKFKPVSHWISSVNGPFEIFSPVILPENVNENDIENNFASDPTQTKASIIDDSSSNMISTTETETDEIQPEIEIQGHRDEETDLKKVSPSIDVTSTTVADQDIKDELTNEVDVNVEEEKSSKFGSGFVLGLILGLAIGALALCCYVLFYVNDSDKPGIDEIIDEIESPMSLS